MKLVPFSPSKFRRRVFSQLWMLALQFVLGMMLNLIGSGSKGTEHTVYDIALVLHVLNALGLVEGGMYIALKEQGRLSWWAAALISATLCAGIVTVLSKSDIWSFVMACGFLLSSWLYAVLYIRADRMLRHPE